MDAWLDEEERVFGHLRDPYHRVDARKSSRQVRILVRGRSVVESEHAFVLSETGLPNRFYLPPEDVPPELLADSSKHTFCPYKGRASYRTLKLEGELFEDAAWLYPEPLPDALAVKDHLAFATGGEIQVEVDGEEVP